jgi:polysaccharide export outer membrane protein
MFTRDPQPIRRNGFHRVRTPALLVLTCLLLPIHSFAQGLAGLNAQDLANLRNAAPAGMPGGLGGSSLNLGSTGGATIITLPTAGEAADEDTAGPSAKESREQQRQRSTPLPPNEFQNHVLQVTGKALPLYGAEFFLNQAQSMAPNRTPVGDDHAMSVGDTVQIRLWGPVEANLTATIDRNGQVALPKLGTVKLAGLKAAQVEQAVRDTVARQHRNFGISVVPGKLRRVQVAVVGLARFPGTYALNSESTLTGALFASGGPRAGGSLRRVELRRGGQLVARFDLYAFLAKGDRTADVRVQDGDVIVLPPAAGYVAIHGAVDQASVLEVRGESDTLEDLLPLVGGIPTTADPRRATLERLSPEQSRPRSFQDISLQGGGLKQALKAGDIVTLWPIVADATNVVTLTGAVARPTRFAWKPGMRLSDVLGDRALLQSPQALRRRDETMLDEFERERQARARQKLPADVQLDRLQAERADLEKSSIQAQADSLKRGAQPALTQTIQPGLTLAPLPTDKNEENARSQRRLNKSLNELEELEAEMLKERSERVLSSIGQQQFDLNTNYAVIERRVAQSPTAEVIAFNPSQVWAQPQSEADLRLEPGDTITLFTLSDLKVPLSARQILVRVEGEVKRPGVYPVKPTDGITEVIAKSGGLTAEAYLFGTALFRDEVRESQRQNLQKILRRFEQDSLAAITKASQSLGGGADAGLAQVRVQSMQQAQQQALVSLRSLKPEGRIALGLTPDLNLSLAQFPALRFVAGDKLVVPHRPDFVYVYGAVNTEAAMLYRPGRTVESYLDSAGIRNSADLNQAVLIRADGSALSRQSRWRNEVLGATVMPGDSIVLPESVDRESAWSVIVRNFKDYTQILYQLGLGAAAVKTLRQ